MTTSFVSGVPRFKEDKSHGRVLGPYSYDAKHPANPPLGVIDPARKSQVFASLAPQRPDVSEARTESFVAPGAYDPKYDEIFPDLVRLNQFKGKRSAIFASTSDRFKEKKESDPVPDVKYTLEMDAADWNTNRSGGGCWAKAPRDSGTIHQLSKRLQEAALVTDGGGGSGDEAEPALDATKRTGKNEMIPLDLCFRELQDLQDMLKEEPQPLYNGKMPRRIAAPPVVEVAEDAAAEAEAQAEAEKRSRRAGAAAPEERPEETATVELESPPHRFVCNTVRMNNNLLPSIAQLPTYLGLMISDLRLLTLLDLSFNKLTRIDPSLGTLTSLQMVRLHANQLAFIEDIAHLKPLHNLKRLTLMSNPLFGTTPDYRYLVCAALPNLKSLDNVRTTPTELRHIGEYAASTRGLKALALAPRRSATLVAGTPEPPKTPPA
tara:strand:- start:681 stop:1982 length:1302 start_codon:yes stop_codon:yes gene_type:complete